MTTENNAQEEVQIEAQEETTQPDTVDTANETLLDEPESEFLELIPEDFRNEPSLKSIKDINGLVKSYVHAQKELGGRVKIPAADAAPEVKQAFFEKIKDLAGDDFIKLPSKEDPEYNDKISNIYNKLGRPDDPTKYDVKLPEDVELDEALIAKFKETAHQAGLSQAQLDALLPLETARITAMVDVMNKQKQATIEYFKGKWGSNYEVNLGIAKATLNKYAEVYPDAVEDIKGGYAGQSPILIDALYQLGKLNQEDQVMGNEDTKSTNVLTADTIRTKIQEMRSDRSHPLNIANHPDHDTAVQELNALYVQASQVSQSNS